MNIRLITLISDYSSECIRSTKARKRCELDPANENRCRTCASYNEVCEWTKREKYWEVKRAREGWKGPRRTGGGHGDGEAGLGGAAASVVSNQKDEGSSPKGLSSLPSTDRLTFPHPLSPLHEPSPSTLTSSTQTASSLRASNDARGASAASGSEIGIRFVA